jgi:hypothetical protein
MYYLGSEHNPPHVHAKYGESAAVFDIHTGKIMDGSLPKRASDMVREWISPNRGELLEMWATQESRKLEPLD